jgi:hypothetical protein
VQLVFGGLVCVVRHFTYFETSLKFFLEFYFDLHSI